MHGGEEVWPGVERKGDKDVGVRQVVFEREPLAGGKWRVVSMQMAHEVALAMTGHAIAENVVVHAAADVDRVDLYITEMIDHGADTCLGLVE